MTSKNDVLTSILTFFRQKFCRDATLLPSPLPTGFTAVMDHTSAGEVPPGRGPQCGAAPIKFRSVSCPGPRRVRGVADSESGRSLTLSQWTSKCCRTVLGRFLKPQRSIHTPQIPGEVSLHLVKARPKPNDPGSLRPSWTPVDLGLKYPCDYGTNNCNPIRPGIKSETIQATEGFCPYLKK